MRLTIADVLNTLVAEGLALPASIDRARARLEGAVDSSPPWFARAMAGFGAWVATGCLLGFLFITKIVDGEMSAILVGLIFIVATAVLRRGADADEEFKRHLAFAGSLAGQLLVIVGVLGESRSAALAGLVALVMSVVLIPLVPDQAQRFMSGLIGSIAALAAMADLRVVWALGDFGPLGTITVRGTDVAALAIVAFIAYVWRIGIRDRPRELSEMLEPVGYGMIVGLFAILLFSSLFAVADDVVRGPRSSRVNAWHLGPLTTAGITAALVALAIQIFLEQRVRPQREAVVVAIAGTVVLGLLTLSTPGLVAAVAALTLGFDRRNRILIWLATVFLVKFASVYYYSLRMTLLEKSIVLVASGVLLIAARAYVALRYGPNKAGT